MKRLLRSMDRPPRSRFSAAPVVLGLSLALGWQLLVQLVPRVWRAMLPGGLVTAFRFAPNSPAGLILHLGVWCDAHPMAVIGGIIGSIVVAAVLIRLSWPMRWAVSLLTVAVILADAGIVFVTLRSSLELTAQAAGVG